MIQMTRTFVQSQPDTEALDTFLVKPGDTVSQVRYRWDPVPPIRYVTLFPWVFNPNQLPTSYQLNYSMGLGSG